MDDSCAVCAESLQWVAYGACGHKEVCSTCVARLRFICDDRRCCICKTESAVVFVTKALGDYTKTINDFSLLPSEGKEGRVGKYWYHEDTQAFFDDSDHYKMIKAMCRLSCSECDRMEDQSDDASRKRVKFRNIEHLKGHLFHKHRLLMCSLCLEGRKVFICEQNLYTRSQLNQHINTGDSEVDGTESERGGFMGHPMCEFCLTPFYGDNELYTHMSTEHYTCHICQRQHPGQYEYYKNYDDLEIHFRRDHFLCEDEACLAKKFIVFQSEAEIKRHNTMEHGGRMSRSQRSAALQIPTSFRYRRQNEQDNRRGRGRMFRRDPTDNELSLAIQASLDIASPAPSSAPPVTDNETTDIDTFNPPFESYATTDSEVSSRYRQAVSQSAVGGALGESAFPPLAGAPGSSQQNPHHDTSSNKTMAARLRQQRNHKVKASSSGQASTPAWPAATRGPSQPLITPSRAWASNNVSGSPSSFGQSRPGIETGTASSNYSYSAQPRYPSVADSFASSLISSKTSGSTSKMSRSASAPKISESRSLEPSSADFPPVSAVQTRKPPATVEAVAKVKDVQTANKSLVEQMRGALGFDEQKFNSFKEISAEFRQSTMDAETYLVYVEQYGLSHLVPELARLLPNAQKQKELLDAYSLNQAFNASRDNGFGNGIQVRDSNSSKKGKGKAVSVNSGNNVSRNSLADDVISKAKELQSSFRLQEGEVEVLSKDGYRADRGKSKVIVDDSRVDVSGSGASTKSKNQIDLLSFAGGNGTGNGKSKQRKKTSKFHRVRLGDGSVEALLDLRNTGPDSDPGSNSNEADASSAENNPLESLPARGVWRNGGGQKLLAKTSKVPRN